MRSQLSNLPFSQAARILLCKLLTPLGKLTIHSGVPPLTAASRMQILVEGMLFILDMLYHSLYTISFYFSFSFSLIYICTHIYIYIHPYCTFWSSTYLNVTAMFEESILRSILLSHEDVDRIWALLLAVVDQQLPQLATRSNDYQYLPDASSRVWTVPSTLVITDLPTLCGRMSSLSSYILLLLRIWLSLAICNWKNWLSEQSFTLQIRIPTNPMAGREWLWCDLCLRGWHSTIHCGAITATQSFYL